jgi:hypothetical protein
MNKILPIVIIFVFFVGSIFFTKIDYNNFRDSNNGASSDVAISWFELQNELIRYSSNYTPPIVARVFGYSGVALYEAVSPGVAEYASLLDTVGYEDVIPSFDSSKEYNWDIVVNETLAEVTKGMFPKVSVAKRKKIIDLKKEFEKKYNEEDVEKVASSKEWGQNVASRILMFAEGDGGHNSFLKNTSPDFLAEKGEGKWTTTLPKFNPALLPSWGENRRFATAECTLKPHPEFSIEKGSDFYKEALEVYETSKKLTTDQMEIAQFWADDPGGTYTPPGHWVAILNSILRNGDYTLIQSSEIYARLGIALSDSFISGWKEKYKYNLIRPISYIQENIDTEWTTLVDTPPFPEYPSGHSVQSGAATAVLTDYFGDNYKFTDTTKNNLGYESRSFNSFYEAAEEAASSRLYGGIHFRSANENGIEFGECIGQKINDISLQNR